MRVASIVDGRPQFVKASRVSREVRLHNEEVLIHTGPRHEEGMGDAFLRVLEIPRPDYDLDIGPGTHARQTAEMLAKLEEVLEKEDPDIVLVYGDSNATLAGALAAAKLHLPVGHVEAGLRSSNRRDPEELNRIVADHLSGLLFCPTQTAVENLQGEGIEAGVHLVGDVMYDVALASAQAARKRDIVRRLGLKPKGYVLATVVRPGTVDEKASLESVLQAFSDCGDIVVFPAHPTTRKRIQEFGLEGRLAGNVRVIDPVDYLDFLALVIDAKKVATDSGGVQKEAYFFGVPCITLRDETEWIETVEDGWNAVVGTDTEDVVHAIKNFNPKGTKSKSFGDGHAAEKIAGLLESLP
ncbi:MAG: UDP-N-acetylglucosamine 2-epimerase (non-hydrolyzing) [Methanobacteriota archaeon]|nr:MAG: UDP-N-acetylglucosamine 2-epimerase (non-hydrolyzing) [Euryarchaeota archaeon]